MKSLAELTEAIEREPDNPEHYDRRAAAYDDAENYEAALEDLNKAVELSDYKNGTFFYHRGQVYSRVAGCESFALEDLNEAIRLGVVNAGVFAYRGVAYRDLHKPTKALADFQTARALYGPGSEGARFCQEEIDALSALLAKNNFQSDELFYDTEAQNRVVRKLQFPNNIR
jgi:tetratricopeptide (TPR) repeat protein